MESIAIQPPTSVKKYWKLHDGQWLPETPEKKIQNKIEKRIVSLASGGVKTSPAGPKLSGHDLQFAVPIQDLEFLSKILTPAMMLESEQYRIRSLNQDGKGVGFEAPSMDIPQLNEADMSVLIRLLALAWYHHGLSPVRQDFRSKKPTMPEELLISSRCGVDSTGLSEDLAIMSNDEEFNDLFHDCIQSHFEETVRNEGQDLVLPRDLATSLSSEKLDQKIYEDEDSSLSMIPSLTERIKIEGDDDDKEVKQVLDMKSELNKPQDGNKFEGCGVKKSSNQGCNCTDTEPFVVLKWVISDTGIDYTLEDKEADGKFCSNFEDYYDFGEVTCSSVSEEPNDGVCATPAIMLSPLLHDDEDVQRFKENYRSPTALLTENMPYPADESIIISSEVGRNVFDPENLMSCCYASNERTRESDAGGYVEVEKDSITHEIVEGILVPVTPSTTVTEEDSNAEVANDAKGTIAKDHVIELEMNEEECETEDCLTDEKRQFFSEIMDDVRDVSVDRSQNIPKKGEEKIEFDEGGYKSLKLDNNGDNDECEPIIPDQMIDAIVDAIDMTPGAYEKMPEDERQSNDPSINQEDFIIIEERNDPSTVNHNKTSNTLQQATVAVDSIDSCNSNDISETVTNVKNNKIPSKSTTKMVNTDNIYEDFNQQRSTTGSESYEVLSTGDQDKSVKNVPHESEDLVKRKMTSKVLLARSIEDFTELHVSSIETYTTSSESTLGAKLYSDNNEYGGNNVVTAHCQTSCAINQKVDGNFLGLDHLCSDEFEQRGEIVENIHVTFVIKEEDEVALDMLCSSFNGSDTTSDGDSDSDSDDDDNQEESLIASVDDDICRIGLTSKNGSHIHEGKEEEVEEEEEEEEEFVLIPDADEAIDVFSEIGDPDSTQKVISPHPAGHLSSSWL